jgi:hypothetical protein
MNAQHTPGSWTVNRTMVEGAVVRWHVASDRCGSVYPICEHVIEQEPDGAEQLANARLIAAAPDYEEALAGWIAVAATNGAYVSSELLAWSRGVLAGKQRTPAEAALAAIAKTEGRAVA